MQFHDKFHNSKDKSQDKLQMTTEENQEHQVLGNVHSCEDDKFKNLNVKILTETILQKEDVYEQEIGSYSNALNRGYYDGQEGTPKRDGGITTSQRCRTVFTDCSNLISWMA